MRSEVKTVADWQASAGWWSEQARVFEALDVPLVNAGEVPMIRRFFGAMNCACLAEAKRIESIERAQAAPTAPKCPRCGGVRLYPVLKGNMDYYTIICGPCGFMRGKGHTESEALASFVRAVE